MRWHHYLHGKLRAFELFVFVASSSQSHGPTQFSVILHVALLNTIYFVRSVRSSHTIARLERSATLVGVGPYDLVSVRLRV